MTKFKIHFNTKGQRITRDLKNQAEISNVSHHFDKKGIEYNAQRYGKEDNRYGWHSFSPSNYCQICGRALSDPKSIERGIGPECAKKFGRNKDFPESDIRTKILNGADALKVISSIPEYKRNQCRFCGGELNQTVYYYEHDQGWFVQSLDKKVWLWIECEQCGHQWSLEHLGVYRNVSF